MDAQGTRGTRVMIGAASFGRVGGIETFTRNLGQALIDQGAQVGCIATNARGDAFNDPASNIAWFDMSEMRLSPRKVLRAADIVNQFAPHILVLNHCALLQYALPLIRRNTKPVVILHSDDDRFYRVATINRHHVFRWIAPTPRLTTAVAGHLEREERRRVRNITHGVAKTFFQAADPHAPRDGMVFIGYLAPNKGADLLPAILSGIHERGGVARLTIVGDGPLRSSLEADFMVRRLTAHVKFVGNVSAQEVARTLRDSAVLIAPTRLEGFGLAIAEAMATGVVPVATRIPGVTDIIISHGTTGFLCRPECVQEFVEHASALLTDASQRRRIGAAASADAASRFSEVAMVDDYFSTFQEEDDRMTLCPSSRARWAAGLVYSLLGERVRRVAHWIRTSEPRRVTAK